MKGENARICSSSSPKNSTRSGSRPVLGKTSTSPPRTAIWPRSSTRSTRSYPARASDSTSSSNPAPRAFDRSTTSGLDRGRRNPFRERAGGDADEPAAREDLERARPLADEVSGRLEPGSCVHAAAREQRYPVGVEVPGDGLGDVARLLVLREQADERAAEVARAASRGGAGAPARRRARSSGSRSRTRGSARSRRAHRRGRQAGRLRGPCGWRDPRPAG